MRSMKISMVVYAFVLLVSTGAHAADSFGKFGGPVIASFLPDGRNLRIEREFDYVDGSGKVWHVPKGATTNGASIPQVLWVAYPPFTGKYRTAAVIHDHYCTTRSRPSVEVHRAFYTAMRAAGVDEVTAKAMYAAVYAFGPRWSRPGVTRSLTQPKQAPLDRQTQVFDELKAWIAAENPSEDQIRERVEQVARR